MSSILNIETSTNICSVSFSQAGNVICFREILKGQTHASQLNIFIDEILTELKKDFSSIDAIALSEGPGSYTGLRIGASTAKGLAYALDLPIITLNSLEIMAYGMAQKMALSNEKRCLMPVIDARRMEIFTAIFNQNLEKILPTQPFILDKNTIDELRGNTEILIFGNASQKCESVFGNINGYSYDHDFVTSSNYMAALAEEKYQQQIFADTAYFEPFYAKAFYSTANF